MYDQQHMYNPQSQDSGRPQYSSQSQSYNTQMPNHPHQARNNGRQAQEEASIKKAAAETKYFWNLVTKNNQKKQQGTASSDGNEERNAQNKQRAELLLFGSNTETSGDVPVSVFQDVQLGVTPNADAADVEERDPIVVVRSGAGEENVPTLENFAELQDARKYEIPSFIIDNICLMKYETPTPIQKHSLPLGIAGFDLMCCAQTGSGKTFSFLLPVVSSLSVAKSALSVSDNGAVGVSRQGSLDSCSESQSQSNTTAEESNDADSLPPNADSEDGSASPCLPERRVARTAATAAAQSSSAFQQGVDDRGCLPSGIILAPTRELVCQINIEAKKLCYNSNIKSVVIYGGTDVRTQLFELSSGCDLIVATPGRLFDLVERGVISFCKVSFLILDEADRMLDMGFEPQIRKIILERDMPSKEFRQTFLFSATFPDTIKELAKNFLRDSYIFISVGRVGSTVKNIHQRLLECSSDQNMKIKLLINTLKDVEGRTLIFVQKKKTASWVNSFLHNYGIKSEEIHGNCTQLQRENSLRNFKNGNNLILIATDVAARGLDVPSVTHVIQFDMPMSSEDFDTYVHRIGRTGRAGKKGVATSFYVPGRGGEGNGGIAAQLLELMTENSQPIPEWFTSLDDIRYSGQSSARRSNHSRGGQGQGQGQGQGGMYNRGPMMQQGYGGSNGGYGYRGHGEGGGGGYGGDNMHRGGGAGGGDGGYINNGSYHRQPMHQQYPQQQLQQQQQQQQQPQQFMRQQMRPNDGINRFAPQQHATGGNDHNFMMNRPGVVPVAGFYNPYPGYPTPAPRDGMHLMTAQMGHMNVNNNRIQDRPNEQYRMQQQQQQQGQGQGQRQDGQVGYGGDGRALQKDNRPYYGGQTGSTGGYQSVQRGYSS